MNSYREMSDSNLVVRNLGVSDIKSYRKEIYSFLQIDFLATYGNKAEEHIVYSKIDGLEHYIEEGMAYPYGAFLNKVFVGFLWGYVVSNPFENIFHIAYIATDTKYRNMGIGNALLNKAEIEASSLDNVCSVELIVGSGNESAIHFYEENSYGMDRYIYRKIIKE